MQRIVLVVATATLVLAGGASATANRTAKGKICGASGCRALPLKVARWLAQRNGSYSEVRTPKPSPYYSIVVRTTGEGYVSSKILWVRKKKVWFDAENLRPPLPGYWRTARATPPALAALATKLRPFPAPKRWVLPHW